ncbi:hypothetical protein BDD43_5161 [Mucilaginibacter gracilis]|uniref:Uncharacterized protein n=1 Tax=Mucilaginibacter gracilis TaxID=423350 RepID=A0A495J8W1_9SPHI|nr:hypothetical protein [Mucilaginibacter gracilis]RKR84908.1 hypothetical protein BDD43_5161 [Mucilaginibacter gracilis]
MTNCGQLIQNMLYDCNNPVVGGTEAVVYLFNRSDIAAYVRDTNNPQIITDITLTQGATGYRYEGYNTSVKPKTTFIKKDYSARFDHMVDFVVFAKGSAVKTEIEKLGTNRVVAIIENIHKSGDSAFEIFGTDLGLELTTLKSDPNDANSEGAYEVNLTSPANFKEPHMPATLYKTSYATTKTALLALIKADEA